MRAGPPYEGARKAGRSIIGLLITTIVVVTILLSAMVLHGHPRPSTSVRIQLSSSGKSFDLVDDLGFAPGFADGLENATLFFNLELKEIGRSVAFNYTVRDREATPAIGGNRGGVLRFSNPDIGRTYHLCLHLTVVMGNPGPCLGAIWGVDNRLNVTFRMTDWHNMVLGLEEGFQAFQDHVLQTGIRDGYMYFHPSSSLLVGPVIHIHVGVATP